MFLKTLLAVIAFPIIVILGIICGVAYFAAVWIDAVYKFIIEAER
jgi:hypothetical protein